jgi:hypothetical protein
MNLDISDKEYEELFDEIKSDDSPVGIDAGKTHVLILYKLLQIESRLEHIESYFHDEEE